MGQPVMALCSVSPIQLLQICMGKHVQFPMEMKGQDRQWHRRSSLNSREETEHIHHIEFFPTDIHHLHVKMPSDFLPHKPGVVFSFFPADVILVWI